MAWAVRTVDNQLEFGRLFDQQICHCGTLQPGIPPAGFRAADIGVGAMGPRFRRDLEAIAYYWAGRRTPPGPIRPGYGALNFQNVPLIAPSK
jgi:hypothetical protein